MTPEEKEIAIKELVNQGIDRKQAEGIIEAQIKAAEAKASVDATTETGGGIVDVEKNNDTPWELGTAGKFGTYAKGASVLGDIYSMATAKKRQEETVDKYKDLANNQKTLLKELQAKLKMVQPP